MTVRTRYAPSPTGFQHLGGLRTALFSYLLARRNGGQFILRIEDTDQNRINHHALSDLFECFDWLGLHWDEGPLKGGEYGPYFQSERLPLYHDYARRLIQKKVAYYSQEEYDGRQTEIIRLRLPVEGSIEVKDQLLGNLNYQYQALPQNIVLIKSDGFPTYHLASIVDDHLMQISHVFRSQEWLPSTPLHVYLYQSLGLKQPKFCHLPLVTNKAGQKYSKRDGFPGLAELRREGYLPSALINAVALLGWSYDDSRDIFSLAELTEFFDIRLLNKSSAVFDKMRLNWLNGHYIRNLTDDELRLFIAQELEKAELLHSPATDDENKILDASLPLIKPRLTKLSEASDALSYLFIEPTVYDPLPSEKSTEVFSIVWNQFSEHWPKSEEEVIVRLRNMAEEVDFSRKKFFLSVQIALTGRRASLPLSAVMMILGKTKSLARIKKTQERIKNEC